ncbi:hypothetical protein CC80DRAFT_546438 [Byssothecium circinans]|uniref:Uncharacterized protein n=1 Tax=Byssothecium circinans TaxID=147558 RepID=A0A6A5U0K6_9PLEO|nr:hypothetical protein CC80DRAFT_546438 [Byssothecium circinans]
MAMPTHYKFHTAHTPHSSYPPPSTPRFDRSLHSPRDPSLERTTTLAQVGTINTETTLTMTANAKSPLLNLPTETFQHVIHHLVSAAGAREARKLRTTCRAFAVEIKYDLVAKQPLEILDSFKIGDNNNLRPFLMRMTLFWRTKALRDADPFLPNKVKNMAHWSPRNYVVFLCGLGDPSQEANDAKDQISIAAMLGNVDQMKSYLPQISEHSQKWFFGDSLLPAAENGYVDIIEAISEYMQEIKDQPTSSYKFWCRCYTEGFPGIYSGRGYVGEFTKALKSAIEREDIRTLNALLAFWDRAIREALKVDYNKWLTLAVENDTEKLVSVRHILQMKVPGNGLKVVQGVFQKACERKSIPIIWELLSLRGISPDIGMKDYTPLTIAIIYGSLEVVIEVLDAGASMNQRQRDRSTLLKVARDYGKMRVERLLLARGSSSNPWESIEGGRKRRKLV